VNGLLIDSSRLVGAISLEQLRWVCAIGVPHGVVLMDAGYGTDADLRINITALELSYVVSVQPPTSVRASGARTRRDGEPQSHASALGERLPQPDGIRNADAVSLEWCP